MILLNYCLKPNLIKGNVEISIWSKAIFEEGQGMADRNILPHSLNVWLLHSQNNLPLSISTNLS